MGNIGESRNLDTWVMAKRLTGIRILTLEKRLEWNAGV
jgi:hypothetical protein